MARNKGCQYQKKSFKFFAGEGSQEPDKCDRCRAKDQKCAVCNNGSEFVDRGFAIIKR